MNRLILCGLSVFFSLSSGVLAWWPAGHGIISEGAVQSLPAEVPSFFREGGASVAHYSADPDVLKNRDVSHLTDSEASEHYLDSELVEGVTLPANRYDYLKLCYDKKLDPRKVGLMPYAVMEWTERLTMAFAEYRRWPENPQIRQKCLLYAGMLSHYAGDLCMPLHTTIHHNGRALPNGESPKTGIHHKVDALIERLSFSPQTLAKGQKIMPFKDLWAGINEELSRSNRLVEDVYRLEPMLPPTQGPMMPNPAVYDFALERGRAGARFVAQLYLTAWENSARVQLPDWQVALRSPTSSAPASQPTTTSAPASQPTQ